MEEKDFYTVYEMADKLNMHPNTIRRAIKNGKINAIKLGYGPTSPYRIPKTELNHLAYESLEKVIDAIVEKREKKRKEIENV